MALPVVAAAAARVRAVVPDLDVWETEPPKRVEGTDSVFVEVSDGGIWGPSLSNQRHTVVTVRVWADRSRNGAILPVADDADRRAWLVWEVIDSTLNDADHEWRHDAPEIHSSRRADGPVLLLIPETDRAVMLTCSYEIAHA